MITSYTRARRLARALLILAQPHQYFPTELFGSVPSSQGPAWLCSLEEASDRRLTHEQPPGPLDEGGTAESELKGEAKELKSKTE